MLLDSILARIVKYVCCCGGIKSLLYLDVECGFVSHDCKFGDVIRVCGRNSIFIACLSMCRLDDITYFCGKICKHRICVCTKHEYE